MPILEIDLVVQPGEVLLTDLAARLADAAAAIFKSPPRGTWVKLRTLDPVQYAENDGPSSLDVFPVFVSVVKAKSDARSRTSEARRLAESFARICGRPTENVHITYEPRALGRVAFGGRLLK